MKHNWILLNLPDPYPICQCLECKLSVEIHGTDCLSKFSNCEGKPPDPVELADQNEREFLSDVKQLEPAAEKLGIKLEHIVHYAGALLKWSTAGYPTRTQSEVDRILAICEDCDEYIKGRCKKCGCNASASKIAVLNKIRMSTERCLLGKW